MLGAADVKVDILPVFIHLAVHQGILVVRVHVAEVVGAGPGETRHRAGLERVALISPVLGTGKRRFALLGRAELVDLRKGKRKLVEGDRGRDTVLVVDRERLAPVPLAAEYGIAEAVVDLPVPEAVGLHILDGGGDGFTHVHPVHETAVHHLAFLGVETVLADIAALDQRDDGKVELAGKGIVATVMGRYRHDGAGTVTCQHIFGDPDRNPFSGQRVHSIGAAEDTCHGLGVRYPLALRLLLDICEVLLDRALLLRRSKSLHEVAFGCEDHERHAEHGVRPGGEYGNVGLRLTGVALEDYFAAVGLADPVALHLLERIRPVDPVQSFQEAAGVGGHAKLPLLHLLLLHREPAAYRKAVLDLVVGKYGPEAGAPVDCSLTLVGDTVVHQHVRLFLLRERLPLRRRKPGVVGTGCVDGLASALFEGSREFLDGAGLVGILVIPAAEHLEEGPLRPLVEFRVAGPHLPVPVVTEPYPVHLGTIAVYVDRRGLLRVLPGLDGILLRGKTEGVIPHGMEHVESFKPLVAGKDVTGDIAQRVAYVESGTRRIREHVQYVELRPGAVFPGLECALFGPPGLPLLLDCPEIVIHRYFRFLLSVNMNFNS